MKIERINENSIALILNNEELKNRNLKMSDLSYGSDKAKDLLVEVMKLVSHQMHHLLLKQCHLRMEI